MDVVEEAEILEAIVVLDEVSESVLHRDRRQLDLALGATIVVIIFFFILSMMLGTQMIGSGMSENVEDFSGKIEWNDSVYMPRHEECIDENNGQDPGFEGYGVGYEPSLSMDSQGNLFITAHKDLRWGGEDSPIPIILDPDDPGPWWACTDGQETSWDYWASWFWISNDGGISWNHGAEFGPTPGNMLFANYAAGGSECLGDEGDISVDANDMIYYLDTTLEDNWWHIFSDGGNTYEMGPCQRMNTMAADDRPWVSAQGDGIIHYLGNSGAPPPECSLDSGRYWYYRSVNSGTTFSQCYSMPGGWSTIASETNGSYVYVAQENSDSTSGTIQVRISDDYGSGTGPSPSDGSWKEPIVVGDRKGNPPEGYPVVNTNNNGTVAVVWADCPNGKIGAWEMNIAISYDRGLNWSTWNITPFENGINMYPFVSISENDVVSIAFYGMNYEDGGLDGDYVTGEEWYLYAGALKSPMKNDSWDFKIADSEPLHIVTDYEESNADVHALHDFFETVINEEGTWMGIAYQQNIGVHPFEENEEQRYIKFVSGEIEF